MTKLLWMKLMMITFLSISFFTEVPIFGEVKSDLDHQFKMGIQSAYYFPHKEGLDTENGFSPLSYGISHLPASFTTLSNDEGRSLGNGWGGMEFQVWSDYNLTIPFLQGNSPMTESNSLQLNSKLSISPLSVAMDFKTVFTPIAFINLEVGSHLGTGWTIEGIGNGLSLNDDGSGEPYNPSSQGAVYRAWLGGTFQFDLAEVLTRPTRWSHVVFSASGKIQYQNYTRAASGESWQYLADSGQNFNGWKFISSGVLGYLIPDSPIDFIGVLIETDTNIGSNRDLSPIDNKGWGSDMVFAHFGPLMNWKISKRDSLTMLVQWANNVQYDQDSLYYNYFQNRQSTGKTYIYFERLALSYTMAF